VGAPFLRVRVERDGGVCVMAVSGELDIATTPELARQAAAALESPPARLVLDLSGLDFIDCAGAGALASVIEALPAGCPVTVGSMSCMAQRVLGVLSMFGLSLERPGATTAGQVPWMVLESQVLLARGQQPRPQSRRRRAERQRRRAEIASPLRLWPRVRALALQALACDAEPASVAVPEPASGPGSGP
jgi:anti-sigma B factor antagonist